MKEQDTPLPQPVDDSLQTGVIDTLARMPERAEENSPLVSGCLDFDIDALISHEGPRGHH